MEEQSVPTSGEIVSAPQEGTEASEASHDSGQERHAEEAQKNDKEFNRSKEYDRKIGNLQKELDQYRDRQKDLEFVDYLRQNPDKFKQVIDQMFEQPASEKAEADPFDSLLDEYDDDTKKIITKLRDELNWSKSEIAQLKQELGQDKQDRIQGNIKTLENHFDSAMAQKGFQQDQEARSFYQREVLVELKQMGLTPELASVSQMDEAIKRVDNLVSAFEKRTLKRNVSSNVPPTGSRKGLPPGGKQVNLSNQADRLRYLAEKVRSRG